MKFDDLEFICPECGNDESFSVQIECWADLRSDGTDPYGDHHWGDDSGCRCNPCSFEGTVKTFTVR